VNYSFKRLQKGKWFNQNKGI